MTLTEYALHKTCNFISDVRESIQHICELKLTEFSPITFLVEYMEDANCKELYHNTSQEKEI